MHASFSVMCTMYTLKNESTQQFCNVERTWYILGHTKLTPWSLDFVFENEERASEIFIFVQKIFFHNLME